MNKISVRDYLINNELLKKVDYITYAEKVRIVDSVMKQVCHSINGTYSLDSVLLDRVKMQIFIEQCTNLNLSIMDDGLDGYDLLKKTDNFNNVIDFISTEINEFEAILQLRINDFIRDKASIKGVLSYKVEKLIDYINVEVPSIINKIENIDVDSIVNNLSLAVDKFARLKK